MRIRDASAMLAGSGLDRLGPGTWADLGCGTGTFTEALADVLAPGSTVYAMDTDRAALARVPPRHQEVTIRHVLGDFTRQPWPFDALDGILMANSLHFIGDQTGFVQQCLSRLKPRWHVVIVEYDTSHATRWVPYPVGQSRLAELFASAGKISIALLGSRASLYHRAPLYAAIVTPREPLTSGRAVGGGRVIRVDGGAMG
jgi:SAM-dependent methyltransferase